MYSVASRRPQCAILDHRLGRAAEPRSVGDVVVFAAE
jgi:hypothetical protein